MAQIEKYVTDGGIFVTLGTTGRHTSTQFNSWPIAKLTGYEVLTLEKFRPGEGASSVGFKPDDPNPGSPWQPLAGPADGQQVYTKMKVGCARRISTGLRMKKVANDAQDLLLWKDGDRRGRHAQDRAKVCIIEFGCKSNGRGVGLSLEAFGPHPRYGGRAAESGFSCASPAPRRQPRFFQREYISNNGLYDVWVVYNEAGEELQTRPTIEGRSRRARWTPDRRRGSAQGWSPGRL